MLHYDPATDECVTTKDRLHHWIKKCFAAPIVSFDTETTGLDVFNDSLVGFSLAVEEGDQVRACYIPVAHHKGKQLTVDYVLDALAPLLEDKSIPKVGSNLFYDMAILAQPRYDVPIENVHDTVLQSYVMWGDNYRAPWLGGLPPGHGMDYLAKRLFNYRTIKFNEVVSSIPGRADFRDVPLDEATRYAAEDGAIVLCAYRALEAMLHKEDLWDVYERDRQLIPVIHSMKQAGVRIDTKKLAALDSEWSAKVEDIDVQCKSLAKDDDFNPGSPQQVVKALEARGIEVPENFKTKKQTVDKFALETLEGQDELVDLLIERRKYAKLLGTYARGLPKKVLPHSNRVHPEFKITRTSTGRLASSEPNLQNLSARTTEGKRVRECVIAGPGTVLVGADYSQIELRIGAAQSQDPLLLKAYRDKIDVHALTASEITGDSVQDILKIDDDPRRGKAKTTNFLVLFGGSAFQLARSVKISFSEAEDFIETYWDRMPRLGEYIEEAHERGRKNGYVETMFGRRVYVPDIYSKDKYLKRSAERLCVSGEIQGTATGDIIRFAMVKVHRRFTRNPSWNARLIITCHDELIAECRKESAKEVAAAMKEDMETIVDIGVPIEVKPKIGNSWKDVK